MQCRSQGVYDVVLLLSDYVESIIPHTTLHDYCNSVHVQTTPLSVQYTD